MGLKDELKKLRDEAIREVRESYRIRLTEQTNAKLYLNMMSQRILHYGLDLRCSKPKLVKGRYGLWYIDLECSRIVAKKLVGSPGVLEFANREDYR